MTPNSTTKLGISVFDQMFGGIYMHRPTIVCGRRKSGKFVVASQLMVKTLLVGDKIVLFTAKNPEEVIRAVPPDIVDLRAAVENGQLLICPYSGMQRSGTGPYAPLPFPQALDELTSLVKGNGVSYAIFDSIVPWTAIHPLETMQEHVDTFFSTLDSLSLTSLLLLPEPASAASLSLATILREVCPINIEISAKNFGAEFTMQVTKYQGLPGAAKKLPHKFALDLTPGVGFDSADAPKAKTISDLEELETYSRIAAAQNQKAAPTFRPFLTGGPANFSGTIAAAASAATAQSKVESQKSKVESQKSQVESPKSQAESRKPEAVPGSEAASNAQPIPSFAAVADAFFPSQSKVESRKPEVARATAGGGSSAATPTLAPPATVPSGAQDGFSFASVIDMPDFPHTPAPQPTAHLEPSPLDPHPPKAPGIQFSSVIR